LQIICVAIKVLPFQGRI